MDSVHFSEFAFQLLSFTSDIIYLQTSGNRKNAKLLKDKKFELRKVTGAVVAYPSPVNKQVEISLFCTQRLIGWICKCWNLLFQFSPQSRTQSPQAPWSAVWSPGETLGKWNVFNFFDWLFG